MCDVYREACFCQENVHKYAKLFKEGWNCIQDKDRSGRSTMVSITGMEESINASILSERRIRREDISEQRRISIGIAYNILNDDLAFSWSVVTGFHILQQENGNP